LKAGAHVNSVGHNSAGEGEVDTGTIRDALVVVESRTAALAPIPSGAVDLLQAVEQGVLTTERTIELGELASGRATGRTDQQGFTLYRSVGVAVEDAAAVLLVLKSAGERGIGTEMAL
jgi:ornithine cyclodeaminase/alanine dehydrogenase-like protein (mu-crystallin family)